MRDITKFYDSNGVEQKPENAVTAVRVTVDASGKVVKTTMFKARTQATDTGNNNFNAQRDTAVAPEDSGTDSQRTSVKQ